MAIVCHVVVIEDLERGNPVGKDMTFAVLPRKGETIMGFGTVTDVLHFPSPTDDPSPEERVQIYVTREATDADRT